MGSNSKFSEESCIGTTVTCGDHINRCMCGTTDHFPEELYMSRLQKCLPWIKRERRAFTVGKKIRHKLIVRPE
jgi:hypothetical protein